MRDLTDPTAATDVTVIGAGPAGTATAALLHKAGLSVRIVERERFPRFVIGESLLPHCMDVLDEADLLDAVKARNYQVKNGALFLRGNARCDFSFAEQVTPGWAWTWQVPRADFDKTLADAVEARGVPIHYEHTILSAQLGDHGAALGVRTPAGATVEIRSRFVVDASGYGRVLPRLLKLDRPSPLPERMALFTHVSGDRRAEHAESNRIWICVHPGGAWLWIIPFSNGITSVGAVASPAFFDGYAGSLESKLRAIIAGEPSAAARLEHTKFEMPATVLRGYSASVERLHGPGYVLVGNATEFLDPVFSSGVTLALESASRAAGLVIRELAGGAAATAVDWTREYDDHMRAGVDVFHTFVTRWYDGTLPDIFFSAAHHPRTRAQICSVLAGYVWDRKNPLVAHHARRVDQLGKIVRGELPAGPPA